MMPTAQKGFFLGVAFVFLMLTIELIRKRRLRENYSLLWIFIGLGLVIIVLVYPLLTIFASWFKASPTSMLMFCGMVALLLLILQLSIMNSSQATQIKNLAQKIALLEQKLIARAKRKK